jgi:hypothetical protein
MPATHISLDTLNDAAFPGVPEDDVPLVLDTPGGNETAFVLDPILARTGIAQIDLLRLPASCTHLAVAPGGHNCER